MANDKPSFWQTLPGIVTALAGAITAITGLVIALNRVGLIGRSDGAAPAQVSAPAPTASAAPGVSSGAPASTDAARYAVEFPSGTEVTLRSNRAPGTYKVLGARVDGRNAGMLALTLSVRLSNTGRSDIAFSTEYFRLLVDDVPRTPTSWLNIAVDARSAEEADIVFDMPDTARNLALVIDNADDRAVIPLQLKKSD
jgi:hypothetical protein